MFEEHTLKMEGAYSYEKLVTICQTPRCDSFENRDIRFSANIVSNFSGAVHKHKQLFTFL
jgi:hypothetical protein